MSYSIEVPVSNSIACNAMKNAESVKIHRQKPGSDKMIFIVKDLSTLKKEVLKEIEKSGEDSYEMYRSYELVCANIDKAIKPANNVPIVV